MTDPAKPAAEWRSDSVPPPIPAPGFYWAKIYNDDRWQPVEVTEHRDGTRFVGIIGDECSIWIEEWGPKMEPPGGTVAQSHLTTREAERIRLCIGVAEGESSISKSEEKRLITAIARVTAPRS